MLNAAEQDHLKHRLKGLAWGERKGRKRDMMYRLFFKEAWLTRGTSGKKIFVFIKTKLRFCDWSNAAEYKGRVKNCSEMGR